MAKLTSSPIFDCPCGRLMSGAPVRVGSKVKLQVADQSLDAPKSVAWTFQEKLVMAPPAAARSVATGTISTPVLPDEYVSRFGLEDASAVCAASEVFQSLKLTPRVPPSGSETGA